ncbi:MAG: YdcF family protein [Lachnospiraceae bacterium]|nr:YdcF family protein [Lachnospiraceae bacterium]
MIRIPKKRKSIGNILIAVVLIFTAYLSVIMIRRINSVVLKDTYVKIFTYELVACGLALLFALDVRFTFWTGMRSRILKAGGWVLRILITLLTAVFFFFFVKIAAGSFIRTEKPADNVLVLGLALENGKPSPDLISRLDTAVAYLEKNPSATLILTGGNADASGKTEAAVMHDILVEKRVPEDRMVLEDQAQTTKANFRNTAKMIDPASPVVLISSNYHMDRAVQTAVSAGFSDVSRLPAPSSFINFGANVMWEVILEINELTFKQE